MVSEEAESSRNFYVAFMIILRGFSGGASGKESSCHAGDKRDDDVIPMWVDSPGSIQKGNPFLPSHLDNSSFSIERGWHYLQRKKR